MKKSPVFIELRCFLGFSDMKWVALFLMIALMLPVGRLKFEQIVLLF